MAVVTNPTALTVVGPATSPAGPSHDEQAMDATNGNSFDAGGDVVLLVRNSDAADGTITFYADILGDERIVMGPITIPGSGTENGQKILGPFPLHLFGDHSSTFSNGAKQGKVVCKASAATLLACPTKLNRSLMGG